ncbi:MAG: beta-ketoacyl-[acyl-carrier-protein] synthase II [Armatimonadota bacterium]
MESMWRRVVVTGMGAITPLGLDVASFWEGLKSGQNGVALITSFDPTGQPVRFAAEVKGFSPENYLERKEARRMDRFTQFAIAATKEALAHSGLQITDENRTRIGTLIASGIGGLQTLEEQHRVFLERGPDRVSPFLIPMMIANMASGQVAIQFGLQGPCTAVVTACAAGTNAIGDAWEIIRRGDADVMIAGGTEAAITPLALASFANARALSIRNDDPEHASRPFDAERDGFVMGEGAGVLVLEELEHALQRGAPILAEITGYAMTADAYHITAPDPEGDGARRVMELAMRKAGVAPDEVDYINAHGTSTPANDRLETLAIKRAFGKHAYRLAISSTKSMTGHLLGAAGAVEAIATVLAIQHQTAPPTINYQVPDPECDLDYVPNTARPMKIDIALSNSFGFGGHNATLVFKRWEP